MDVLAILTKAFGGSTPSSEKSTLNHVQLVLKVKCRVGATMYPRVGMFLIFSIAHPSLSPIYVNW